MVCNHLRELYRLCETQQLRLSSSDLIHVVCTQCDQQEVCPSTLTDEYDALETEMNGEAAESGDAT